MRHQGGTEGFDQQVARIAALGEPIRRALYRYVSTEAKPVGREQAASAVGVARHVAKFHLDRLEAEGLLDTEYSRPPGRRGPGAGRPAKRYRRSTREVSVSLPARRYDLVGHVMAQAITTATKSGAPVAHTLHHAAAIEGRELGELVRARLDRDPGVAACLRAIGEILAESGYEPRNDDGVITLVNCPFRALADEHPDLVCGMNLDLIRGLLETCSSTELHARLDPAPGRCCVTLRRRRESTPGRGESGR